ncbi:MAG: glycosyl transferase family 1, partial [Flavobacteriaceae bacterium]
MKDTKKVLILSYYWPPSGGSGVQRWMYFTKYLRQLGWEPIVITVDETQASYPVLDFELLEEVKDIQVIKTDTKEPLKIYSQILTGS